MKRDVRNVRSQTKLTKLFASAGGAAGGDAFFQVHCLVALWLDDASNSFCQHRFVFTHCCRRHSGYIAMQKYRSDVS
jgi:hypothetical protein